MFTHLPHVRLSYLANARQPTRGHMLCFQRQTCQCGRLAFTATSKHVDDCFFTSTPTTAKSRTCISLGCGAFTFLHAFRMCTWFKGNCLKLQMLGKTMNDAGLPFPWGDKVTAERTGLHNLRTSYVGRATALATLVSNLIEPWLAQQPLRQGAAGPKLSAQ